jgi:hypothetical protein
MPVLRRLCVCLLCGLLAGAGWAGATTTGAAPAKKKTSPYAAKPMPESARNYYALYWGVDELSAKLMESGALVRFNYRVVDATKAQALQDKAASPTMIDEKAKVSLVVPTLEKVGPLRQAMPVENGKTYWMAFSNKGSLVKPGHRVSVVIGPVRIDGLIVQ